jgi:hypothetical protein
MKSVSQVRPDKVTISKTKSNYHLTITKILHHHHQPLRKRGIHKSYQFHDWHRACTDEETASPESIPFLNLSFRIYMLFATCYLP